MRSNTSNPASRHADVATPAAPPPAQAGQLRRTGGVLREHAEKHWPALCCALGGGLRGFVLAPRPAPLTDAIPVFCYHVTTANQLAADLEFLKANRYTTLDADGLLDHLRGRRRAPARSVVLSFDDGSANLYHVVFPLLQAFGAQAVAFICPGLHRDEPAAAAPPSRENHWASDLCTWPQLIEMQRSGYVDIQSHTLEHRHLRRWPSPVRLTGCAAAIEHVRRQPLPLPLLEDLRRARELLEARLDKRVHHLAFPRMLGTPAAIDAGHAAGYKAFWRCVTPTRCVNRPGDPPTAIVRLNHDLLHRLPGRGRRPLISLVRQRLRHRTRPTAEPIAPPAPAPDRSVSNVAE